MANYNKSFNFRNGVQVDDDDLIVRGSLVGIGTTIPRAELDVYGTIKSNGIITANNLYVSEIATFNDVQIGTGITIIGNSGTIAAKFYGDGAGLYNIPTSQWVDVDPAIYPGVGLGYSSIWAGGTVGIGTTIPRSWLQIGGDPNYSQEGVGISSTGNVVVSGILTSGFFVGVGSDITDINASNISSGILNNSRLPSDISVSGVISASTFSGQVNAGIGTIVSLTGTNLNYIGVGTIATFNNTTGTITNLISSTGTITNLISTNLSGTIGTISTFSSTNAIISNLSGTIGTVTDLNTTNLSGTIGTISTFSSANATISNLSGTIGTITDLKGNNLNYSGIATIGFLTATNSFIGIVTATNLQSGNITLGLIVPNQIDTTTGNLILQSAGGSVNININLDISGTSILQGEVTANTGIVADVSTGAYLGQSGKEFSELWVDDVKIGVGVGNSNKIETLSQDLVLDAGTNQTVIDSNLRIAGVTTVTGNLTLGSGIEPITDNVVTLGTSSKRFGSSQVAAIRIGVAETSKIDTILGTNLVLDSDGGTTTVDDNLVVTGTGTFNSEVKFDTGIKPDISKGSYIGTPDTPFSEAHVNEVRIGVGQTNKIDTRDGSLILDGANNLVEVDNNLVVGGVSSLTGNLTVGDDTEFVVNTTTNRVGIGTDILTRKFQVKDTTDLIAEFGTNSTSVTIGLGRSSVGAGQNVGKIFYSTNSLIFDNEDLGGLEFITNSENVGLDTGSFRWRWGQNNGIPLLDLTYDGKLGLGITNPSQTLHVVGTSTITGDAFFGSDVTIFGTLTAPNFILPNTFNGNLNATTGVSTFNNIEATANITVSPASSIGIGTTNPITDLDGRGKQALFGGIGINTDIITNSALTVVGGVFASSIGIGTTSTTAYLGVYGNVEVYPSPESTETVGVTLNDATVILSDSGGVGIGTTSPRSIIDFADAGKTIAGQALCYMIPPRITTVQRIGLSTEEGALIFNTDTKKFQGYTGVAWTDLN